MWLATLMSHFLLWHQVGRTVHTQQGERWWADVPREQWPMDDPAFVEEVVSHMEDGPYGDRAQVLVVIGLHMDKRAAAAALRACLLTDEEMQQGPQGWAQIEDPFAHGVDSTGPGEGAAATCRADSASKRPREQLEQAGDAQGKRRRQEGQTQEQEEEEEEEEREKSGVR